MIYPNMQIKQAVEAFLELNPWAFEYVEEQNYIDI
jgi:hypothetical protein